MRFCEGCKKYFDPTSCEGCEEITPDGELKRFHAELLEVSARATQIPLYILKRDY